MTSNFKYWVWENAQVSAMKREGIKTKDIASVFYHNPKHAEKFALILDKLKEAQPIKFEPFASILSTSMSPSSTYRYLQEATRFGLVEKEKKNYSISLRFFNTITNFGKVWELWSKQK